jgi:hypothetical protein
MEDWKPIHSAPKNGTPIRIKAADGSQKIVVWSHWHSDWVIGRRSPKEHERALLLAWGSNPTHWKPIS